MSVTSNDQRATPAAEIDKGGDAAEKRMTGLVLASGSHGITLETDPVEFMMVALGRARDWLEEAERLEDVRETKAIAVGYESVIREKDLAKAAELAATEIVRRCERRIGALVRQGQREGVIRMRGQREDLPRTGDLASPMAASGMGLNELTRSYTMANATVEDFERAVSEARDECNLSRANVVRKIKGTKPKPGERTEWHHNRRHIDSTRILSTLTQELDAATAGLELIEPDDLEEDFVTECAVSIRQSLAVIQATLRRIQRDRRDESGQTH